jgi:RNA polymerase sigma-70 factor, ECF subfamily
MVMPLNQSETGANGIKHIDGLYRYAVILTLEGVMAEELVEKTYVRAMTVVNALRLELKQKIWLFTILRDVWRVQVEDPSTTTSLINSTHIKNEALVGIDELSDDFSDGPVSKMEQVRAAVEKLPVELREMILLREWEGLAYREIADAVKCSTNTVMSRLCQARSKLLIASAEYDSVIAASLVLSVRYPLNVHVATRRTLSGQHTATKNLLPVC